MRLRRSSTKKMVLFDLRQHNIDKLRYYLGTYDWAHVLSCNDANTMYSLFLVVVRYFTDTCIPTKTVTLGPRDPDFATPLVKSLLCKRRKLRRQGKDVEADALAAKINPLICAYRKTRLSHLSSEAGPKELWEVVRATSTKSVVNGNLSDPNLVNNQFAAIATDHLYNLQDVLQYYAVQ